MSDSLIFIYITTYVKFIFFLHIYIIELSKIWSIVSIVKIIPMYTNNLRICIKDMFIYNSIYGVLS
jgi:hypothetical protein